MVPRESPAPSGGRLLHFEIPVTRPKTDTRTQHPNTKRSGFVGDLTRGEKWPVTYEDIVAAREVLRGVAHRTPLTHSRTLSRLTGGQVYLKLENLQRTGAFKLRGAFHKVATLTEAQRQRGIVTASAGNHAQGVALAAAHFGVPCTVVMPEHAPATKITATRGYGAEVRLVGQNYDESYQYARQLAGEGRTFVHAFDDPAVIAGQGTIGLEILEDDPAIDTLIVPVGGGGLMAGIAIAVKSRHPQVRVVGVQPAGSNAAVQAFHTGVPVHLDAPQSLADGLMVKAPGELPMAIIRQLADDMVTVTDDAIRNAILFLLERTKLLVEGAGAAGVAALLGGQVPAVGRRVAVILSGGNLDLARLHTLARSSAS
ncbi:threonine ammonia-lyase [Alicyclobacillus macrosporangiidus]|uniref:threonine ammonia-lyase n=1 Tax=Alicyclobacillus macrosporangiidus TaxID=392015 RepID=UPI0018CC744E|nr:threonine ammonia-lyase [Alicyclobacillus macrosporangiidus]